MEKLPSRMPSSENRTSRSLPMRKRGWDFLRASGLFCGRCSRAASGYKEAPNGCWHSSAVSHHEIRPGLIHEYTNAASAKTNLHEHMRALLLNVTADSITSHSLTLPGLPLKPDEI